MYGRGHARGCEEGGDFLGPLGLGAAGAGVGVDEDVGAFAACGRAVSGGEEGFDPLGDGVGRLGG